MRRLWGEGGGERERLWVGRVQRCGVSNRLLAGRIHTHNIKQNAAIGASWICRRERRSTSPSETKRRTTSETYRQRHDSESKVDDRNTHVDKTQTQRKRGGGGREAGMRQRTATAQASSENKELSASEKLFPFADGASPKTYTPPPKKKIKVKHNNERVGVREPKYNNMLPLLHSLRRVELSRARRGGGRNRGAEEEGGGSTTGGGVGGSSHEKKEKQCYNAYGLSLFCVCLFAVNLYGSHARHPPIRPSSSSAYSRPFSHLAMHSSPSRRVRHRCVDVCEYAPVSFSSLVCRQLSPSITVVTGPSPFFSFY